MTEAARNTATSSDVIADRYGTKRSGRLDRRLGWVVASVAVLAGIGYLATSNFLQQTLEFKNVGFTLNNEADGTGVFSATTRFEVTAEPGAHVSCAVEALNTAKATVAWKVVDLPVHDGRTQTASVDLITLGPATAAHVKLCWQVDE